MTPLLANTKTIKIENMWLFDTGATHHLTHNKSLLHDYVELTAPLEVRFGDNGTKFALGKGTVHLPLNKHQVISISNVYYVPSLARNLLSIGEATRNGAIIEFHNHFATIKYNLQLGQILKTTCPKLGRLYPLQTLERIPIKQMSYLDAHLLIIHYYGTIV